MGIAQIFKTSRGNSKHSKLIAKLYILASLIILINFDKKGMDPRPLERHGKSLVACQITPCLQNMGTANTFTWNSRLRERLENLVRLASCPLSAKLGNGEYLYMEFTLEKEARKFGAFGKLSLVCKTWEWRVPLHGIHSGGERLENLVCLSRCSLSAYLGN